MKNIVTIFFLILFLFFIIGYKGLFTFLQYKAEIKMDQRLDNEHYSNEETISLKIPLTLPYQIHNEGYQRVSGKFEHEGEFYHIVKQKIERDTLYVVCIKNNPKKKLAAKMADFEDIVNHFPASNKSKNLLQVLIRDYIPHYSIQILTKNGWCQELAFFQHDVDIISRIYPPVSPPPECIA